MLFSTMTYFLQIYQLLLRLSYNWNKIDFKTIFMFSEKNTDDKNLSVPFLRVLHRIIYFLYIIKIKKYNYIFFTGKNKSVVD